MGRLDMSLASKFFGRKWQDTSIPIEYFRE
jgi:hypothetical protein